MTLASIIAHHCHVRNRASAMDSSPESEGLVASAVAEVRRLEPLICPGASVDLSASSERMVKVDIRSGPFGLSVTAEPTFVGIVTDLKLPTGNYPGGLPAELLEGLRLAREATEALLKPMIP